MIEKLITNDLTLRRWRIFKQKKMAFYSFIILLFFLFITFASNFIANSKPLVLAYKHHFYFPILKTYHPKEFGLEKIFVIDYKKLKLEEGDFVIWPLIKWDPFESNKLVDSYPAPPTKSNLMGTDDRGRDVLTRLLYGFKYSIVYAFLVWAISFFVGTILGGIMGYFGGRVDLYGQRMIEVLSTVPQFFLLIILIAIFSPSLLFLVAISSLFAWIPISYYIRAEFLKNRNKEYVESAKAMGASHTSIIFKHILPNSLTPIITFAPFVISGNIVSLASLDYLGFGLEAPTPSWGELLAQAQQNYTTAWWLALYPSLALFITLSLLNLIGDGVRDALDPKLAK